MGGEPTFVSIDDFEAPEWNTAAVGPTKRGCADDLIRRLRDALRARAACCITARASGIRARACRAGPSRLYWRQRRQADLARPRPDRDRGRAPGRRPAPPRPSAWPSGVAERLGLDPAMSLPAYEDPAHWLLKEGELPANVDLRDPKLDGPGGARAACVRDLRARPVDARRLCPAGPALERAATARRWMSERWRSAARPAVPGPGRLAGRARLPLELACPGCRSRRTIRYVVPQDPFEQRGAAAGPPTQPRRGAERAGAAARQAGRAQQADGRRRGAHRADASSRATACSACSCRRSSGWRTIWSCSPRSRRSPREAGLPIQIEGYPPPHDPRLERDQGDARPRRDRGQRPSRRQLARGGRHHHRRSTRRRGRRRLGADKFMIDGRHTGTGGGNHVVLGGVDAGRLARSCAGPTC